MRRWPSGRLMNAVCAVALVGSACGLASSAVTLTPGPQATPAPSVPGSQPDTVTSASSPADLGPAAVSQEPPASPAEPPAPETQTAPPAEPPAPEPPASPAEPPAPETQTAAPAVPPAPEALSRPRAPATAVPASGPSPCDLPPPPALNLNADPATRAAQFRGFRDPLPPAPLWNPPGQKQVGLQAGHWLVEQVPEELRQLGGGAVGGGKQEWEANLEIAQRTKSLLEAAGIAVDLLPSTVPPGYRAHAFLAIHADGDASGQVRGFKVARPGFSSIPQADDRLVAALEGAYGQATQLPRDDEHISLRMRYYYAFNSRRYCHSVAPGVPQAIIESGFLTSAADRQLLLGNPDLAARGIADGLLAFLELEDAG
ncbi:MAG: N-acetylmuramoyl-L-alanine amidase [Chloroflexi bacterium]|nr:N-acetylmuramoyl-L-alanine amidase [Chloroflexota bacterium]